LAGPVYSLCIGQFAYEPGLIAAQVDGAEQAMVDQTQSVSRRILIAGAAGATVLAPATREFGGGNFYISRRKELQE